MLVLQLQKYILNRATKEILSGKTRSVIDLTYVARERERMGVLVNHIAKHHCRGKDVLQTKSRRETKEKESKKISPINKSIG